MIQIIYRKLSLTGEIKLERPMMDFPLLEESLKVKLNDGIYFTLYFLIKAFIHSLDF